MPNFSAHLGMAKDAASRLDHPTLNNNMGAFLLGSVSPDIRIITRGKRDDTHFVPLDFEREGDGIEGLFHSHPNLAQASDLNEPTKAFIVGFASHLFTDELWILNLYRPYFGNREVFEDKLRGNLMDRALQLELDRREHLAMGGTTELKPFMTDAERDVDIGFISAETLVEWREWVQNSLGGEFTWERLRFMARRVARQEGEGTEDKLNELVDEFLESVPDALERIYCAVPEELVAAFRERSIEDLLSFARGYLP